MLYPDSINSPIFIFGKFFIFRINFFGPKSEMDSKTVGENFLIPHAISHKELIRLRPPGILLTSRIFSLNSPLPFFYQVSHYCKLKLDLMGFQENHTKYLNFYFMNFLKFLKMNPKLLFSYNN